MENGETYDYYWNNEKNIPYVVGMLSIEYKYEKMEDMEKAFLKECVNEHCKGLDLKK